MRLLISTALLCVSVAEANAQAFGVAPGSSFEDIAVSELHPAIWEIKPPKPNPLLMNYESVYSTTMGFCDVKASSRYPTSKEANGAVYGDGFVNRDNSRTFGYWNWEETLPPEIEKIEMLWDGTMFQLTYAFPNVVECYRSTQPKRELDNTGL
jgi:hypothetical protein